MKIENKAKKFSQKAHKNQFRKFSGVPYVTHPINVAKIIKENKKSKKLDQLISAALLHDTLEDTSASEKELTKKFGELITSLVKELTTDVKEKNKLGKREYLTQKMIKMSNWALLIKLADRLDNVSDLKNATKEFQKNYIEETVFILENLKEKRKLTETQNKLLRKIELQLNYFL